ncbi:MAG: hypothetical protein JJU34_18760 [Lunatimonas sp.]|uniref:hypothetical protein n=1 Tax=Lunatimonas sp. TaxID=2060141 RepID=UPI00263B1487|nr:hypothetical protein [Lunatimonas sp.]MCC5939328.1 hypothetical protein [Lunatimonas sp.]
MRTFGMMGEAVGYAAYVAKAFGTSPRGVYANHLDTFMGIIESPLNILPVVSLPKN